MSTSRVQLLATNTGFGLANVEGGWGTPDELPDETLGVISSFRKSALDNFP